MSAESSGSCEVTDRELADLDSLSFKHNPVLQVAITKGAPHAGGLLLPELHPAYLYRLDRIAGKFVLFWERY